MNCLKQATKAFARDELVEIALKDSPSTAPFAVSKALLCDASDYFRKALTGDFSEAEIRRLTLPGCDEPTLRLLLFYLYRNKKLPTEQQVFETNGEDEDGYDNNEDRVVQYQCLFVKLWVFADAYLLLDLGAAAIKALLAHFSAFTIRASTVELTMELTVAGSTLRRMIMAEAIGNWAHGLGTRADIIRLSAIPAFLDGLLVYARKCINRTADQRPSSLYTDGYDWESEFEGGF